MVSEADYSVGIEMVRSQRDSAIHQLGQAQLVAREVLAMDRLLYQKLSEKWYLGMPINLLEGTVAHQKWRNLVDMAREVVK